MRSRFIAPGFQGTGYRFRALFSFFEQQCGGLVEQSEYE